MLIKVNVACVGDEIEHTYYGDSPERCLDFLNYYNHEGAEISIEIHENDNEKVYGLLEHLKNLPE
jgi:hypothetical protein